MTPIGFQLNNTRHDWSHAKRYAASSTTVISTTMVSWTRRLWVVHDTLFSSASVAIRKSANAGMLTTRQDSQIDNPSSRSGTVNWTLGNKVIVSNVTGPLAGWVGTPSGGARSGSSFFMRLTSASYCSFGTI